MSLTQEAIFEVADLSAYDFRPETARHIPRAIALRFNVLALCVDGSEITVGFADPPADHVVERLRFATGKHVRAVRLPCELIRRTLRAAYPPEINALRASEGRSESPVVRALEEILDEALAARASDVHLEPGPSGGRVRLRTDGRLFHLRTLAPHLFTPLVSRVKLLAGMDIAEKRRPQDGRYMAHEPSRTEARVASMPTPDGEKLVLRLMGREGAIPTLRGLGLRGATLDAFLKALGSAHGLLVACGPTGSGKTTTLYSAIRHGGAHSRNICSVEDPIEIRLSGITQTEVNERAGCTFESALRGFLRQDPDVIVVGEMRDAATARAALTAAQTGRLVLTSLHAPHGAGAVERLQQLGISREVVRDTLAGILSQRLVCLNRGAGGRTGIFAFDLAPASSTATLNAFHQDAAAKIADGSITPEAVAAVLGSEAR